MTQTQTFVSDNLWFDCQGIGADGDRGKGISTITMSSLGNMLSVFIEAPVSTITMSSIGLRVETVHIIAEVSTINVSSTFDDILIEKLKDSWIQWSQIGYADFTIGRDNTAGKMPMGWDGTVYDIRKLGKQVMVYGANGVSRMTPAGPAYGMETLYTIGVKSKNAVCGDDNTHYFIDKIGQLWQMTGSLKKLDYSEYLSVLTSPVMSWDNEKNLIYICDGTNGFVYSPDSQSMGSGPESITSIRYKDGTSYVGAPSFIEMPYFELTTDIYDFGTRKEKTVFGMEVSTDLLGSLQATIEYRASYKKNLAALPWQNVTPEGKLHLPCYGVEFRFKLRSLKYEYFELDWMKVNGVIHGFSHLDIQGRDDAY